MINFREWRWFWWTAERPGSAPYCRVAGQTLKAYKLVKEFLNHVDTCEHNPWRSTP
jgi:hypothetical protein